jgi:hypothetical protein
MGRISLKEHFGEDAEELKSVLMMFGGYNAEIVGFGKRIPTQVKIDTCMESAKSLEPKNGKYRKLILDFIKKSLGNTCDEIEVALQMRHQTASCFIRFLVKDGFLRDSGERRLTRANRKAIVWVAI